MNPPYEWTVIDSLGLPITFGSNEYVEVYSATYWSNHLEGGIREDTTLKKVYFTDFIDEMVLYDFSLDIGDTIFYSIPSSGIDYYKVVQDKYSVIVSGQMRNMFYLKNSLYNFDDYWIEGIGSVYRFGLLYPIKPYIVMDGSTPYFGCFSHDSITYINENACISSCPCSWWIVNTDDFLETATVIEVIPNPFSDIITVKSSNAFISFIKVEIFNSIGSRIVNKSLNQSNEINIDVSSLPNGIYILKTTYNSSYTSVQKIIKYE